MYLLLVVAEPPHVRYDKADFPGVDDILNQPA